MKKLFLFITIFLITAVATADAGVTLRPMFGFGMGILGTQAPQIHVLDIASGFDEEIDDSGDTIKKSSIQKSFGQGLVPNFDIDIGINDHFAIYTGVGYTIGLEQVIGKRINEFIIPRKDEIKAKGSYLGIRLGIKTRAEVGRFCPYVGLGMLLAVAGSSIMSANTKTMGVEMCIDAKTEYSPMLGVTSCLGADIKFNDTIALFFQITGNIIKLKRKSSRVIKAEQNNINILDTMNESAKVYIYKKDGLDDGDPDTPTGVQIVKDSFSTINFSLGLSISF